MRITTQRSEQLIASPWKNGGGVTRVLKIYPPSSDLDTFVWRVSMADVSQVISFINHHHHPTTTITITITITTIITLSVSKDGPFSLFPGVDRTLVLLKGSGMVLDEVTNNSTVNFKTLETPLAIVNFVGETPLHAHLINGPTRDFNLMV